MESSEEDFFAVMLISLSRIASRWMLLIPNQMELLTLFVSEERSLHIQATSLRCQRFLLARGDCSFASATDMIYKLFATLEKSGYPPLLRLEALKVLHKTILFNITPCIDMPELFPKLLKVIENMLHSSNRSNVVVVVSVLADLSGKLFGRADLVLGRNGSWLAVQVISFILDQILSLVTEKMDVHQPDLTENSEVRSLLEFLFNLVEKQLDLCCLVLNNICLFLDKLVKTLSEVPDTEKANSHVKLLFESKGILYLSKIVAFCLQNLEETDTASSQVLDALKLQLENLCCDSHLGSYGRMTWFLLLHLHAACIWLRSMSLDGSWSLSGVDSVLQLDILAADCANKMLGERSYWSAYTAGKLAACCGAWSTAALLFEQLVTVVQSSSCSCWLNSLAQFSTSEKQIQLFLLRDQRASFVPSENGIVESRGAVSKINYGYYAENLFRTCNTLLSAEKILATSGRDHIFSFQRWFLTLRAKVLKTVADIMKLSDRIPLVPDGSRSVGQLGKSMLSPCTTSTQGLPHLINSSAQISCQMSKLAQELDLLSTSFMGIDRQSGMIVSTLALSCSLMAFTAGFAFLNPDMLSSEKYGISKFGTSEEFFQALLIEDLLGRFRIDGQIGTNLLFLLKSVRNGKSNFPLRFQAQVSNSSYEASLLQKLCECSVRGIVTLQNKAIQVPQDGDAASGIISDGLELLLNISSKLMLIPFRTPPRFFRVRPSVSSELFVLNEDGKHLDRTSVLAGFHLSLNLGLQLKNMPPGLPLQLTKVYCILSCKNHSLTTTEIGGFKDLEMDDMVDLNGKLLRYITGVDSHGVHCKSRADDGWTESEYICFKLNGRGQGFSTCLLDVSAFPVGSYRIKWHCGCINDRGSYWSLLPLNVGPSFTVHNGEAI